MICEEVYVSDAEWHTMPFNVVFEVLKSGTAGLTTAEARARLENTVTMSSG